MLYQDYINRKEREHGEKFDPSELAAKFIPYFENGRRIEIVTRWGETKRGTVGVTTGWKPVFLLKLRSNSIGSSITLTDEDQIIQVIR